MTLLRLWQVRLSELWTGPNRLEGLVRVVSDEGYLCPDSLDRGERSVSLEGIEVDICHICREPGISGHLRGNRLSASPRSFGLVHI